MPGMRDGLAVGSSMPGPGPARESAVGAPGRKGSPGRGWPAGLRPIIGAADAEVAKRLDAFKESLKEKVAVMNEELKNQLGN